MRKTISYLVCFMVLSLPTPILNEKSKSLPPRITITTKNYYHGNIHSKIYHKKGCRYYNCKNCIVLFKSEEDAKRAGYTPCKLCIPLAPDLITPKTGKQ
ncbi:sunset domain-containing protein [Desulfocicer vacuolatum]|uniref:sunset domain-containing protein n=1 Tax=Desulfocicer vacuolatum TaxID=2298 RepID=UPI000A0675E0